MNKLYPYTWWFIGIVAVDRLSKMMACSMDQAPYYITPFFSIQVVINRGISWGLLAFESTMLFGLITAAIVSVYLALLYVIMRHKHMNIIGEVMVLAGGLCNIIDRFIYGGAIDFLALSWHGWEFPVFNVADIAIVLGVMMIGFSILRQP